MKKYIPYSQLHSSQQPAAREAMVQRRVSKSVNSQKDAWAVKFEANPKIGEFSPFKNYK